MRLFEPLHHKISASNLSVTIPSLLSSTVHLMSHILPYYSSLIVSRHLSLERGELECNFFFSDSAMTPCTVLKRHSTHTTWKYASERESGHARKSSCQPRCICAARLQNKSAVFLNPRPLLSLFWWLWKNEYINHTNSSRSIKRLRTTSNTSNGSRSPLHDEAPATTIKKVLRPQWRDIRATAAKSELTATYLHHIQQ